jgi:hypothetical protein
MIYSCFNEQTGLYEYLEDDATQRMNGDLPIPSFPMTAGEIGVPAREAGRPAPIGARKVGQGLEPRGVIVQCENETYRSLDGVFEGERMLLLLVGAVLAGGMIYVIWGGRG